MKKIKERVTTFVKNNKERVVIGLEMTAMFLIGYSFGMVRAKSVVKGLSYGSFLLYF